MDNSIKNYCTRCEFDTNHVILHSENIRSDNDNYDYAINYLMVKCQGCDNISFREEFIDIEASYPDEYGNWRPEINIENFPKKLRVKQKIENSHVLPLKIRTVYEEAIKAYNADCFILSGVAFRAVIEAICLEEKILGSDLGKKINSLTKKKLITQKESNRLHSIRFIGNDSVHEMKVPKEDSLKIVLNIVEHLLNNLYLIDYNSKDHLETVIDQFPEFYELLILNIPKFQKGDEIPLAKILGKNVRRFIGNLIEFEKELMLKINNSEFNQLSIGKFDIYGTNNQNKVQHFII